MSEYTRRQTVRAPAGSLFGYLARIENLPRYFDRMTSAEPGPATDEVRVTARVEGRTVAGTARFHVDQAADRIEWSSEGPNGYHGWLEVSGAGDTSEVEVHISSERVADHDGEIEEALERTLGEIRRLVESGSVTGS